MLEQAVQDGAGVTNADDTFAVVGAFDEAKNGYSGLKIGEGQPAVVDRNTLLVKTSIARA